MRVVILGIHEAETILLVERDCIQIGVNSQETEINMHSDCHCEPRRGEAIPIQIKQYLQIKLLTI